MRSVKHLAPRAGIYTYLQLRMSRSIQSLRSAVASSSKTTLNAVRAPARRVHSGPYTPGPLLGPGGFDSAVHPVHSTLVPYVIEQTVSFGHL